MVFSKNNIIVLITTVFSLGITACGDNSSETLIPIVKNSNPETDNSCDIFIDKTYYQICYDYDLKGARFVTYTLQGSNVDKLNIKDRPDFYEENSLDYMYRSKSDDYLGSGYDRGHLANDASFDWSNDSLNSTYSMANIIPQYPSVNRYTWIDTENLEREKAKLFSNVKVFIGVVYSDNPQRLGDDNIAIPKAFYKSIQNINNEYQECFYYDNTPVSDVSSDSINDHKVNCSILSLNYTAYQNSSLTTNEVTSKIETTQEKYSCNIQKNCTAMSSCEEALFYLNECKMTRLDRDSDGIPCESICNN